MKRFGRAIGIALLAWLPVSLIGQSLQDAGRAFVWRINPADYFFAEARFGEWFSRTNDVVFLQSDSDGGPVKAIALVRKSDTSYKVSLYEFANERDRVAGAELRTRTAMIDAAIGRQLEAAVRFRLRGLVLLDPQPKNPGTNLFGGWWIFQRDSVNKIDTALILVGVHPSNEQARAFTRGIIDGLARYVENESGDRSEIAAHLNDAAAKIAKGELPDR